jgi:hypothetical protein
MPISSESSRFELTEFRVLGTSKYIYHSMRHVIPKEVKGLILLSIESCHVFVQAKRMFLCLTGVKRKSDKIQFNKFVSSANLEYTAITEFQCRQSQSASIPLTATLNYIIASMKLILYSIRNYTP